MDIVITEFGHLNKLHDSSYLYRFTPEDIRFVITGYTLDSQLEHEVVNQFMIRLLESKGYLEIVNLSAKQNERAFQLYSNNRTILFESVAALVYAEENKLSFMTEDTKVMEFGYGNFDLDVHSSGKLNKTLDSLIKQRELSFKDKNISKRRVVTLPYGL